MSNLLTQNFAMLDAHENNRRIQGKVGCVNFSYHCCLTQKVKPFNIAAKYSAIIKQSSFLGQYLAKFWSKLFTSSGQAAVEI